MTFIQAAIADKDMVKIGNGALLIQYLRAQGINPSGNVIKARKNNLTIYTEIIDGQQGEAAKISEVDGSIRDSAGENSTVGNMPNLWL